MTKKKQRSPNPAIAVVLACAVPGAGHMYLGRARRGIIIFLTLTALFWTGVGFGGVMTVDARHERWWFMAQMLSGVNGLIAWQRERQVVKAIAADGADEATVKARLIAEGLWPVNPTDTVARAYSGVAGLMNLMCMFDVLLMSIMGIRGEPGRQDKRKHHSDEGKRSAA